MRERRREIRESTTERIKHTRQTVKEVTQKKAAKQGRDEACAKNIPRKVKISEQMRERVRKYRERKKIQSQNEMFATRSPGYSNRMAKKRGTDKLKAALLATPSTKAAIIKTIVNSPRTRKILEYEGMMETPKDEMETRAPKALASDISDGLQEVKKEHSNEKHAAFTAFKSLAFGKNVKKTKAEKSLSKIANVDKKNISKPIQCREKVLKGDLPSWQYTKRKLRQDAISEEDGKVIYDYWTKVASRPTGDKKDVVKQRTGKQQYVQHVKHVLEKTQTEAYLEYRDFHPEIQVKQRKFENLKPFFVKQAKERDGKSCLCRKHVETKMVFSACMKFSRKATLVNSNECVPIPTTLTECVDLIICRKPDGSSHHQVKCLERECSSCGIDGFKLLLEEICQE